MLYKPIKKGCKYTLRVWDKRAFVIKLITNEAVAFLEITKYDDLNILRDLIKVGEGLEV